MRLRRVEKISTDWGTVQSVEFKGVSEGGADQYAITHQSGKRSQWLIQLGEDGKVAMLAVLSAFQAETPRPVGGSTPPALQSRIQREHPRPHREQHADVALLA